jgi:hypothetical protein
MMPGGVLVIFVLSAVVILFIFVLESALFLIGVRWYYRLGPPLHREEWQTSVSADAARSAIRASLGVAPFASYDWGDAFGFRRPCWKLGAWPRVTLGVQDRPGGAILTYEVRPFITMALMALVMCLPIVLGDMWRVLMSLAVILGVVMIYIAYWRRELGIFDRLGLLRCHLHSIGVLVCDRCGYDLHGRDIGSQCPECGHISESKPRPPDCERIV